MSRSARTRHAYHRVRKRSGKHMHMLSIPQRAQNEQKYTQHTPSREIIRINANGTTWREWRLRLRWRLEAVVEATAAAETTAVAEAVAAADPKEAELMPET